MRVPGSVNFEKHDQQEIVVSVVLSSTDLGRAELRLVFLNQPRKAWASQSVVGVGVGVNESCEIR
jgi:hypothetical protein